MPRPQREMEALVDARRRAASREHAKAAAIRRAVADVIDGDLCAEEAARNRGVPVERVRAAVASARLTTDLPGRMV